MPTIEVAVGVAVTTGVVDTVNCDVHTRPLDASFHGILGMVSFWNGKIKYGHQILFFSAIAHGETP